MTIKQSASLVVLLAAVALSGAGCLARTGDTARTTTPARPSSQAVLSEKPAGGISASDIDTSDWTRYESAQAGQIGMSFLYPPELTPVKWDTAVWGANAIGVDFGGFGIARIPNDGRGSVSDWLTANVPGSDLDLSPLDADGNPFGPALRDEMCEAVVVTDDADGDAGPSGIGGTTFVNAGGAALYAFALGQDWNQEIGDREVVIKEIMASVEWFAERTECGKTVRVRDDRVGIAFDVPRELAPVVSQEEFGWGMEQGGQAGGGPLDCLTNRVFLSLGENQSTVFLTANDTWECEIPGRGGYWGDQARAFVSEEAVAEWCQSKDGCESFVNSNGVTVWHAHLEEVEDWGNVLRDIDEYAAFNPERSIHGILLSNQGFLQNGLGRQEDALRSVADSLSFLE